MKFYIETSFNNKSLPRFSQYEIKSIDDNKYVVPVLTKFSDSSIDFYDYEENDMPLVDFINLGKMSLESDIGSDDLLLKYVNKYGLLGLINNLPINRYWTLDKLVLLRKLNCYINDNDYGDTQVMNIIDYFKIFFPTYNKTDITELIEKTNKFICQNIPEKMFSKDLDELYYKNENYFEPVTLIMDYAQFLYKVLLEFYKDESSYVDTYIIEKHESNHIRNTIMYDGIKLQIRSLKDYLDEEFKLYILQEKKHLKVCKHCGKAFIAQNPKAEYDTFSCKNQENVYKSRARLSSNVITTKEGIAVKITPSKTVSDKILGKNK